MSSFDIRCENISHSRIGLSVKRCMIEQGIRSQSAAVNKEQDQTRRMRHLTEASLQRQRNREAQRKQTIYLNFII